jgi:hypothetical protein
MRGEHSQVLCETGVDEYPGGSVRGTRQGKCGWDMKRKRMPRACMCVGCWDPRTGGCGVVCLKSRWFFECVKTAWVGIKMCVGVWLNQSLLQRASTCGVVLVL